MTDVGGDEATFALSTAADQEYEGFNGVTFPGLYAMIAQRHMHEYGTTREQLAQVAVKNHENGSKNPLGPGLLSQPLPADRHPFLGLVGRQSYIQSS